ncbi:hypothetical protein BDR03DRAFT_855847, partial [Suillus americanus]
LEQKGTTGVSAMQLTVISDTRALIINKVEHNPMSIGELPAWVALFSLRTHAVRPLEVKFNSFCAGGTFLSNGTLINVGGNPNTLWSAGTRLQQTSETSMACRQFASSSLVPLPPPLIATSSRITPASGWLPTAGIMQSFESRTEAL